MSWPAGRVTQAAVTNFPQKVSDAMLRAIDRAVRARRVNWAVPPHDDRYAVLDYLGFRYVIVEDETGISVIKKARIDIDENGDLVVVKTFHPIPDTLEAYDAWRNKDSFPEDRGSDWGAW